jgi:hypothetical protein
MCEDTKRTSHERDKNGTKRRIRNRQLCNDANLFEADDYISQHMAQIKITIENAEVKSD